MIKKPSLSLSSLTTFVLVCCAVIVTVLLVRRELRPPSDVVLEWRDVDGWQAFEERFGGETDVLTLYKFSDPQCQFCQEQHEILRMIERTYVENVQVVRLHFPLPRHLQAAAASEALECARDQQAFEAMLDVQFERPDLVEMSAWDSLSFLSGVDDPGKLTSCVESDEKRALVNEHMEWGRRVDVRYTPTILLEGKMYPGRLRYQHLKAAVDGALAEKATTSPRS